MAKIDDLKTKSDTLDFLKLLQTHEYYDIYIWDKALKHFQVLLTDSQSTEGTQLNKHEDVTNRLEAYKAMDLWAHYMDHVTEGDDFKLNYYTRLYNGMVREIYTNFFELLSPAYFRSYLKSEPEAVENILKLISRNYEYLIEV